MSNDRWYLKPNDAIKTDSPGDFIDESQVKEDTTYYKVVVQMSQDEIKNFSGKPVFDPSFFNDFTFVDSLKYSIAEQYLNAAYGSGIAWDEDYIPFEQYSAENKEKLISSTFITKKNYITKGKPGLYYFLGLFGLGPTERAIIKNTEAGKDTASEAEVEVKAGEKLQYQKVDLEEHQEDLKELAKILGKVDKDNEQLKQPYQIDLKALISKLELYSLSLAEVAKEENEYITDVINGKAYWPYMGDLEVGKNDIGPGDLGEGKEEDPEAADWAWSGDSLPDPGSAEEKQWISLRKQLRYYKMDDRERDKALGLKRQIRYAYETRESGLEAGGLVTGERFNVIETAVQFDKCEHPWCVTGDWPENTWSPWDWVSYLSAERVNNEYGTEVVYLIFNLKGVIKENKNKTKISADSFIKKWIRPIPLVKHEERIAAEVFNDASAKVRTKTLEARKAEMLTDAQKAKIHKEVKLKYYNTSDLAFLNMLEKAQSMKTIDDIFELVLHAIPLESLTQTVIECLMKALHLSELKSMICDAILDNINEEEINLVLQYLETSTSDISEAVRSKMAELIEQATSDGAYAEVGSIINNQFSANLEHKDLLCLAILTAIPLAAALALGFDEDYELSNPAEAFLGLMEKKINRYSVTGLTDGWRLLIINAIESFLDEFVTQTVIKMIEEISYLCEGSADADLAGMPVGELPPLVNDVPPVLPFTPFSLPEAIPDENPENVIQDIIEGLASVEERDDSALIANIKLFLNDLGTFLTVSEICTLISSDANAINKKYVLNKVFSGLLSLDKFSIMRKVVNSLAKLEKLFFILGSKISDEYCVKKTLALDAAKKVLSTFCGPASNAALIEDLKNKATQDAIDALLGQEKDIKKDLVKGIVNLSDLTRVAPDLFCGSDSKKTQEPIFPSHQHDSEKYLADKTMKKVIRGIDKQYNQDLILYKGIFLSSMSDITDISGQIGSAMYAVFKPAAVSASMEEAGVKSFTALEEGSVTEIINKNKYIAQQVYDVLIGQDSIMVNTNSTNDLIAIKSKTSQIALFFNYSDVDESGIPPKSAALIFGDQPVAALVDLSKEIDNYENTITHINTFNGDNSYDTIIKDNVVTGLGFYGNLLNQVLTEHAEYISQQDLFQRKNFTKLKLTSQESSDPCEVSLLDPVKIIKQLEVNIKALECKKDFSEIPSAFEVAQINMLVEILHSTLIAQEFLKSIFVFAAFNLDALLPEDNELSFYYDYLQTRIDNKISSFNNKYSTVSFNLNEVIAKYSTQVYAANNDKVFSNVETYASETKLDLFQKSYTVVRDIFAKKLKDSGYNTPAASSVAEEFEAEDASYSIPDQILKNIIPNSLYNPPKAIKIDYSEKKIFIEKEYYSKDPRLKNGGFFIEQGYDVVPRYKGDSKAMSMETWKKSLLYDLFTKFKDAGPDMSPSAYEKLYNTVSPDFFGESIFPDSLEYPLYYFNTQKSDLATQYIQKASYSDYAHVLKYFNSIGKVSVETFQNRYKVLSEETFGGPAPDANVKHWMLQIIPNAYKKYTSYYTLNLLLRVSDVESMPALDEEGNTTNEYSLSTQHELVKKLAPASVELALLGDLIGFHDAVLDKKYFIQEEGGPLYFKLPLLTYYSVDPNSFVGTNQWMLDKWYAFNNQEDLPKFGKVVDSLALEPSFKKFTSTTNYKELLSYLAIVTSDAMVNQYPALDDVFNKTVLAVINALNPLLAVANRQTDPDFYKTSNFTDVSPDSQDLNWLPMIMKAFLETIANMVDPTWKTDWLLPGPLTPFGIAAKLLEGVGEGEGDGNENPLEDAVTEDKPSEECTDE